MSKPVYIHYGNNEYYTPDPIRNSTYRTKPCGGLWASRKEGDSNWINWCKENEFHLDRLNSSFEFTLKDDARVLVIDDPDKLDDLPKLSPYDKNDPYSECRLDFEKLRKDYDAVEVMNIWKLYWPLYGWDCNSIVIMNPNVIEIIKGRVRSMIESYSISTLCGSNEKAVYRTKEAFKDLFRRVLLENRSLIGKVRFGYYGTIKVSRTTSDGEEFEANRLNWKIVGEKESLDQFFDDWKKIEENMSTRERMQSISYWGCRIEKDYSLGQLARLMLPWEDAS